MNNFLMILETFLFIRFSNVAVEISSYGTQQKFKKKIFLSWREREREQEKKK
jgi:hypothetical protein